jgi:hypothetical protein
VLERVSSVGGASAGVQGASVGVQRSVRMERAKQAHAATKRPAWRPPAWLVDLYDAAAWLPPGTPMGAQGVERTVGAQGKREVRTIQKAAGATKAIAQQGSWLSEYWWVALGGALVLVLLLAQGRRA